MLGLLLGGALKMGAAPALARKSPLSGLLSNQRARSFQSGGMGGVADEAKGQQPQPEQSSQQAEPMQEFGAEPTPVAPAAQGPQQPQPLVRQVAADLKAQQAPKTPPQAIGGPVTSELLADGPVVPERERGSTPVAPAETAINPGEAPTPTVVQQDQQFPNTPQVQPQEDAPDQISERPQQNFFAPQDGWPTQPLAFEFSEAPMMGKSYMQTMESPGQYVPQFRYSRR